MLAKSMAMPYFCSWETMEKSCDQRTTLPLLFFPGLLRTRAIILQQRSRVSCVLSDTPKNIKFTFRMEQCSKIVEAPSTFHGSYLWPLLAPPSNLFLESKAGDPQRSSSLTFFEEAENMLEAAITRPSTGTSRS